jgi:hypothetical protein
MAVIHHNPMVVPSQHLINLINGGIPSESDGQALDKLKINGGIPLESFVGHRIRWFVRQ